MRNIETDSDIKRVREGNKEIQIDEAFYEEVEHGQNNSSKTRRFSRCGGGGGGGEVDS